MLETSAPGHDNSTTRCCSERPQHTVWQIRASRNATSSRHSVSGVSRISSSPYLSLSSLSSLPIFSRPLSPPLSFRHRFPESDALTVNYGNRRCRIVLHLVRTMLPRRVTKFLVTNIGRGSCPIVHIALWVAYASGFCRPLLPIVFPPV